MRKFYYSTNVLEYYTITNLFNSYVHTSNTSSRIPSGRSYQSTITVDDG